MMTLDLAERIAAAALDHGSRLSLQPLTVAVLDAGGHLVILKRQDGSGILRPAIAGGKAWGALGMGHGSRMLAKRAEAAPAFVNALASASDGRMIPAPGGVLIRDEHDRVVGAIGISGDTSDHDEACAVAGIAAVGMAADTGEGH
ncbi:GlcG/HbpS family heme-binding protein [Sphingomonas bacterium]|uniref:GlcG/HbpS family heme-binding protein n=1 Tax=Sphingomonas bacterium TaxID=1895847 RepID=UPI001575459D|nr:heme-binding protein [Sphingomonas bacterium]